MTESFKKIDGWFPDSNADFLDILLKEHNVQSVVEIGSYVGKSTVFFAERVKKVYAVDTFEGTDEDYIKDVTDRMFERFIENTKGFQNIAILKGKSVDMANKIDKVDMVFIDGSHRYEDVKDDIKAWQNKCLILCGDDYHWDEVKQAVEELLNVKTNGRIWLRV
jgi:predicted O-methyltransferase YrrM